MANKISSDSIALYSLEKLGYQVEKIQPSEKKEADFIVSYKNNISLVEAKLKKDSDETIENREKDLSEGRVSVVDSKLGRNETYSGIIRSASNQLSSSSDKPQNSGDTIHNFNLPPSKLSSNTFTVK